MKTCEDFVDDFLLVIRMNVMSLLRMLHCIKSVRIRSYSGPHFLAFGLNTKRYDQNRITPNMDTFYAVLNFIITWVKNLSEGPTITLPEFY